MLHVEVGTQTFPLKTMRQLVSKLANMTAIASVKAYLKNRVSAKR